MITTKQKISANSGFTLVEMLVVLGLIALLSSIVLIAVNPSRQFKLGRDSERSAHLTALLNAIGQDMAENKGQFMCGTSTKALPTVSTQISSTVGDFDLASCIVPLYLANMPYDPNGSSTYFTTTSNYRTGYSIMQDANAHITLTAPSELDSSKPITATR